jgi:hypothetical protein
MAGNDHWHYNHGCSHCAKGYSLMSTDISIATTFNVPNAGAQLAKPPHLIVLNEKVGVAKNSHNLCFLTTEPPIMNNTSFIQAHGCFSEATAEEIVKGYRDMVLAFNKDQIEEITFSWSDVKRVKNLTYKAK